METVVIFDTETTSLEKPYCYNIGYVIVDPSNWQVLEENDFVVEQIWHNLALFNTAYYANKRPLYVSRMRARSVVMDKFGYICQKMVRDFRKYNVVGAYAYNSNFDDKVFSFNCDWFRCVNPFDNIPIYDIRGYAHHFICNGSNFYNWCEENTRFSDSGNYSTTAETVYQYLTDDTDFSEEHTALNDSRIETEILKVSVKNGAKIGTTYKAFRSLSRNVEKTFTIKDKNKNIVFSTTCNGYTFYKKKDTIQLK